MQTQGSREDDETTKDHRSIEEREMLGLVTKSVNLDWQWVLPPPGTYSRRTTKLDAKDLLIKLKKNSGKQDGAT